MAITKIKPIKSSLKKALDYIMNPAKTDGKMLVSSFGCSYETADIEFELTLSQALDKGNNLAHHLIQSFQPGEATPEQAHEIGKRLADEVTKGRYEYVLTTHIDKGHIHNHLIFCAASFIDHKKYISNKKSYYAIRNTSDKLCKEYGLSVVKPGQEKGRSYAEYAADRGGGGSWKSKLKVAIDTLIPQSKDMTDFIKRLQEQGYDIKRGKYISVRAPGQERFTRTKTLGVDYTEDVISKRIAGEYTVNTPVPLPGKVKKSINFTFDTLVEPDADIDIIENKKPDIIKRDDLAYIRPVPAINLIVDIENSVKAQQNAGFARWQKIQNLKEAAKTLNFLTENNLLQYTELESKAEGIVAAFDMAGDSLKAAEKRLADMSALMKHITTYQQTKPIYDGLKVTNNKGAYRIKNESAIILHEAAVRALRSYAGDGGKLPNPASLQKEYARLMEKKSALRIEYDTLKRQARAYGIVKRNVDNILNPDTERTQGKEHRAELL